VFVFFRSACADWLPWGQDAISKYRSFKHLAAFSLQKLLCNIAETPVERLIEDGERSLRHVARALETEVKEESELRDSVFSCGECSVSTLCTSSDSDSQHAASRQADKSQRQHSRA
jgi:hypothetical protein